MEVNEEERNPIFITSKLFEVKNAIHISVDDAVAFRILNLELSKDAINENPNCTTNWETPATIKLLQNIEVSGGLLLTSDVEDYDFEIPLVLTSENDEWNSKCINSYLDTLRHRQLCDLFHADFVEDSIKLGERADLNAYKLTCNFEEYDANEVLNLKTKWSDLKAKNEVGTMVVPNSFRVTRGLASPLPATIRTSNETRKASSSKSSTHFQPSSPAPLSNQDTSDRNQTRKEVVSPMSSFHDSTSSDSDHGEQGHSVVTGRSRSQAGTSASISSSAPKGPSKRIRMVPAERQRQVRRDPLVRTMKREEMQRVLDYICANNLFEKVSSNSIWQEMVEIGIVPDRSFHTLRNNFHRSILPKGKLETFTTSKDDYAILCSVRRPTQM